MFDLLKIFLFCFLAFPAANGASTFATTTFQPTVLPTSPSTVLPTSRPTVIPSQRCTTEATMNIYLNYFFDTGLAPETFNLYLNILTNTTAQPSTETSLRYLSIYGASANGSTPNMTKFSDLQTLESDLFSLYSPPFYPTTTSSVIQDLTNYQSVLPSQLTFYAAPVIVMFLKNPLENIEASVSKMIEIKNANPTTFFMGILLSRETSISKLPFDYTLKLSTFDQSAPIFAVDRIFAFICTVT